MGQNLVVTGMVLSAMPIGEYDKRIVLLTKERGKISAFARGARRVTSSMLAATDPFSFGEFELFEGRSSYTVAKATISNYFRELALDCFVSYTGFYFLEIADYFCQENNDEREMLKLLYQSMKALLSPALDNRLVRLIFEWKALFINGIGPSVFSCGGCRSTEDILYFSLNRGSILCGDCARAVSDAKKLSESSVYTLQYIYSSDIKKLYQFTLTEDVLKELETLAREYMERYVSHTFHSRALIDGDFDVEIKPRK